MPSIHVHIHRPSKTRDAVPHIGQEVDFQWQGYRHAGKVKALNGNTATVRFTTMVGGKSFNKLEDFHITKLFSGGKAFSADAIHDAKKFVTKRDYRIPDDPIWERRAGGILPSSTVVYEVSPGQYRPWFHKGSGVLRLDPKDLVTE